MSSKTINTPRITIGLPVYNVENHIKNTLESILSQTFEDFELIISDNASCDQTEQICRDYAQSDGRIRYIRNQSNVGAATNYNNVFHLARGEYFKWAAGDDMLKPDYLRRCAEVLDNDASVVIAYPRTTFIDNDGNPIEGIPDPGWDLQSDNVVARLQYVISAGHWCNVVFGLIRYSVLNATRLIAAFPGQDYGLLAELSLKGKFYEVPEYLFLRRIHARASSQNTDLQWQIDFLDPAKKDKVIFPYMQRSWEHFTTVMKSKLPLAQKIGLIRLILRQLRWHKHRLYKEFSFALKRSVRRDPETITYDLRKDTKRG